jgi:hypothetical protein
MTAPLTDEQKVARLDAQRKWRTANPTKSTEHSRKWRLANPEKVKAQQARERLRQRAQRQASYRFG